jgi:prepilin-type N-terminal cleavage/methylation domain-containing protein
MCGSRFHNSKFKILNSQSGFSLVEVIVAIVLLAIMMIIMGRIYATETLFVVKQGDRRQATFLAKEALEAASVLEFSTVASNMATTVENDVNGYTGFTRTTLYDYVLDDDFTQTSATATNSIRIMAIVSSAQGDQGFHDITLTNVVTDWQ